MTEEELRKVLSKAYIKWVDYGCEGWQPQGFDSAYDAITSPVYGSGWIITKPIKFEIKETDK